MWMHVSLCRGVPYFIINNKYSLEGANPPSAFVSVFRLFDRDHDTSGKDN